MRADRWGTVQGQSLSPVSGGGDGGDGGRGDGGGGDGGGGWCYIFSASLVTGCPPVSPSVASPPRGVTDHITVLPAWLEFLTRHNGLDLI